MEVYRAAKSGDAEAIKNEMGRLQRFSELTMQRPFMEEFGMFGRESPIFLFEFPRMLQHMLSRTLEHHTPHLSTKKRKSTAST